MKTLGQLKLELMSGGVHIADADRNHESIQKGLSEPDGEISFALAQDFFVRTTAVPESPDRPRLTLRGDRVWLISGKQEQEVLIIAPPRFLAPQNNPDIHLDGYCLNLFLRQTPDTGELNMKVSDVLTVTRAAFEEGAADLIQLNMEYCAAADRGVSQLVPLIQAIKKNFRTFVSLRGFPPEDLKMIDLLYAAGVELLVWPLAEASSTVQVPVEQGLRALEYAAGVFSHGTVSTELGFGSGDLEPLQKQIARLAHKKITPTMTLAAPRAGNPPDFKRVQQVAEYLSEQAGRLNLKWLYPSHRLLTPLDTRFFTEPADQARLTLRPMYQSILGKSAFEGFTALRRKLRVKNISDSYQSAGL